MIVSYNVKGVGDTLIIITGNSEGTDVSATRLGNVACVKREDTGEIVGWNIFEASHSVTHLEGDGQINLTPSQMTEVNHALKEAGFEEELILDNSPKFVIGHVKTCVKHEDSDHLHVTEIEVDNGEVLQIVCGASNIREGLKVVVAKVGAMMPNGLIIWPGELRGVASSGMVCSAKELHLPNAPEKKGILELPEEAKTGEEFTFNVSTNEY